MDSYSSPCIVPNTRRLSCCVFVPFLHSLLTREDEKHSGNDNLSRPQVMNPDWGE